MSARAIHANDSSGNLDRWAWAVALLFVVVTLGALVVIPLIVQRRVDESRAAITDSEPARTLLMGLQYNLVREMSTLNQHAVTGDPRFARTFVEVREAERRIWNELAPLARNLGPVVNTQFIRARDLAETWHIRLNEDELLRSKTAGLATLQAADVRERFEQVLTATAQLDSAILNVTNSSRTRIQQAERSGLIITLVSGALALVAAGVVAALVLRVRRLAQIAERRRRQAAEALEQSARAAEARQRLLRGITHDVKNPLGAARGYAELLAMGLKGSLNPEQDKLVEGIERSINNALAIISDLLDLARTDSGGVTVHRVNIDLNDIARQAVDDHHAAAETAGHEITCEANGKLPSFTDPTRVRQVLDNLITNAIKYTPAPGRITVRTDANANDAPFGRRAVAIRVSDNGPGIPADQRERIFDEFTRLDDNSSLKGHGLGLAIARRMARLLGGELGVAESGGRGATFALWLPQREQREETRESQNESLKVSPSD
jgi:signal transduction histidine kinase